MTMEPIRTGFSLSEADFVAICMRLQLRSLQSKPWIIALYILFPIWICYLLWDSPFPQWIVVVIMVLSCAWLVFGVRRRLKKLAITTYRENFRNQEIIRFSADEQGFTQEGATFRTVTGWEKITRVEFSEGAYLLFIAPLRAIPVPAGSFPAVERARFEALLERVKPGWRK